MEEVLKKLTELMNAQERKKRAHQQTIINLQKEKSTLEARLGEVTKKIKGEHDTIVKIEAVRQAYGDIIDDLKA